MAPHCDTMDGPVVMAAEMALEMENVSYVLPFVPRRAEAEIKYAFDRTLSVRELSEEAAEIADYWFFETAVRLHREGEGKPYTGLKPAGLDWGPVVKKAEKAIEKEDPTEIIEFILRTVEAELLKRFDDAVSKRGYDVNDVDAARDYVGAMLDFVLYSHHLYKYIIKK